MKKQEETKRKKNSSCQKRPAVPHQGTSAAPVPCLEENISREVSPALQSSTRGSAVCLVKVWSGMRFFTTLDILSKAGSVSCFSFLRKMGLMVLPISQGSPTRDVSAGRDLQEGPLKIVPVW